jgi:hypothetical protein
MPVLSLLPVRRHQQLTMSPLSLETDKCNLLELETA